MGTLTVLQIATRVRRQFGDADGVLLTDQAFFDWINDAMREIVLENDLLKQRATSATVIGQSSYTIPLDLIRMHSLSIFGLPIRETSFPEARDTVKNLDDSSVYPRGTPEMYWVYGGNLFLYPAPDRASSTGLLMNYNRAPVAVALMTDIPELNTRYDTRLIEYCAAQAADLDQDSTRYAIKKAEFQMGISEAKDEEGSTQEYYPFINYSFSSGENWTDW